MFFKKKAQASTAESRVSFVDTEGDRCLPKGAAPRRHTAAAYEAERRRMRKQMRRDRLKARRQRGEPSATPEVQVFFPAGPPPVRRIFESPADDAAARVTTSADSAGASASARGPGSGEGHDAGKSHDDDVPAVKASHHPFTLPVPEHVERLAGADYRDIDALLSIRSQHYDLVCNGVELGGGSVRCVGRVLSTCVCWRPHFAPGACVG